MKQLSIFFCIIFLNSFESSAQLYDEQWVFAPNPSVVDFRNDTVTNDTLTGFFNIFLTSANICDSSGDLICSTNGINIYDRNGNVMINGDSLNPCPYTEIYASSGNGLNIPQGALFLPIPGNRYYRLIHFSNDTVNEGRPGTLYYSIVDAENGLGTVTEKNVPFCKSVFREGGMTACKHANGRDYWVVMGEHWSNIYYIFLVTPDSIYPPLIQSIGPEYVPPYDVAYSKFSQDGSKYVTGCYEGLITVMDFDRCSGEFSNPITIFNEASSNPVNNPVSGCASVEFSQNGRFVYVSDVINLNQYDLEASNIQDSIQLYWADSGDYAEMDMLQLGPNGKLYATTWNGGFYYLDVVNRPDEKGDSCGFVDGGYTTLTEDDVGIPNMINYNLGPLVGSVCDSIDTPTTINLIKENTLANLIRVLPNPADKYLYIEMGMQADYEFDLINSLGQVVGIKETKQVDIFNTENLASGIYFIKVIDKGTENVASKKVVVQH